MRHIQYQWPERPGVSLTGSSGAPHPNARLGQHSFRHPLRRRESSLRGGFGAATGPGDAYEIEAPTFGKSLPGRVEAVPDKGPVRVMRL